MKQIINTQLNEIKTIEQTIQSTKLALKSWASQIGKYHMQLKTLSQQLNTIKQQLMNNNIKQNHQKTLGGKP